MKLNADALSGHLQKNLAPIYIISGDETLLLNEACDAIIQTAATQGFNRELHIVDRSFDWPQWHQQALTRGLFQEKTLLDIQSQTQTLNKQAQATLVEYATNTPKEKILLLRLGKLDKRQQSTKWFKTLEQAAVFIQVWPVNLNQFPNWLRQRLQQHNIRVSADALKFMAARLEGNLLAAQQVIEKLQLLYPDSKTLELNDVQPVLADSAHYSVFDFADSALRGEAARLNNILHHLQHSGGEPTLILWSLAKELRLLAECKAQLETGQQLGQVKAFNSLWQSRKTLIQSALQRYPAAGWRRLLHLAQRIDTMIKGGEQGDPWLALHRLALAVAGTDITR